MAPGVSSAGVFAGDNPLKVSTVSLLILQIFVVVALSRTLGYLLKPLRQPLVIAEIIAGILIGPSAIGRSQTWLDNVFPSSSLSILTTIANVGLIFFLFLVGLEIDISALRAIGKNAVYVSLAGIALPFVSGVGASFAIREILNFKESSALPFVVFMGVAMSITAFPVLARILAERKLLITDIGQLTMSAAAVDDVIAWILLALAVALINSKKSPVIAVYSFLCLIAFIAFMLLVMGPLMKRVSNYCKAFNKVPQMIILGCFLGALGFGFITDLIGVHAIFGGFIFGFIIPKDGPLTHALVEKLEDVVIMLFIPLFFASSGLKTQIGLINTWTSFGLLVLVIAVAMFGKITGCTLLARFAGHTWRKSMTVGILMNTKGLVELIVLNIGLTEKVINEQIFAIMVLMALFTTFITSPLVAAMYNPSRDDAAEEEQQEKVGGARLQKLFTGKELSVLACISSFDFMPSMINLIEATNSDANTSLKLDILHLLEVSERTSTFLQLSGPTSKATYAIDPVNITFKAARHLGSVKVDQMVAVSNLETMHEDVFLAAKRKKSNMIIIPFNGASLGFGGIFDVPANLNQVAKMVLKESKVAVGLMIDHVGSAQLGPSADLVGKERYNILVPFVGGADDRAALSLSLRMLEHPQVSLTVYQLKRHSGADASAQGGHGSSGKEMLIDVDGAYNPANSLKKDQQILSLVMAKKAEDSKDENAPEKLVYEEEVVEDVIKSVVDKCVAEKFDLIILGLGGRNTSPIWIGGETPTHESESIVGVLGQALLNTPPKVQDGEDPSKQPSLLVMQAGDGE